MQRSAGFTALQAGDFETAFAELATYHENRPSDHRATYNLAIAAFETGRVATAARHFTTLYEQRQIGTRDLIYYYALLNWQRRDVASRALDQLLIADPAHVAGRVLRGILLQDDETRMGQARNDFLQADESIRANENADFASVFRLHRYAQEHNLIGLQIAGAVDSALLPIDSALSFALGQDIGTTGYINQFTPSHSSAIVSEPLTPRAIVGLYLAYVLMREGSLEQAESELSEVLVVHPESLAGRQAQAFLAVYNRNFQAAAAAFASLSEAIPDDATTRKNLANALWLTKLSPARADPIIAQYQAVLAQTADDPLALTNLSYLYLAKGDFTAAADLFASRTDADGNPAADDPPAFLLNRGLAVLQQHQYGTALAVLRTVDAEMFPEANNYVINALIASGEFTQALALVEEQLQLTPNAPDLLFLQMLLHESGGEMRLAYFRGEIIASQFGETPALLARLAYYAQSLGDAAAYQDYLQRLAGLDGEDSHRVAALQAFAAQTAGDAQAAAQGYARAAAEADNLTDRNRYLAEWAVLRLADDAAAVVSLLANRDPSSLDATLQAILAYAHLASNPDAAATLAEEVYRNPFAYTFWAKKYAGLVLAHSGAHQQAREFLDAAHIQKPGDLETLQGLQTALNGLGDARALRVANRAVVYLQALAAGKGAQFDSPPLRVIPPPSQSIATLVADLTTPNSPQANIILNRFRVQIGATQGVRLARLLLSRGSFFVFTGNFEAAVADLEEVTKTRAIKRQELIEAFYLYQRALVGVGRYRDAFTVIKFLITTAPGLPTYQEALVAAEIASGQYDAAQSRLEVLISEFPLSIPFRLNYARLFFEQRRLQPAYDAVIDLLNLDRRNADAYGLLAEIYRLQGKITTSTIYGNIQQSLLS